jgi:hypothetical protein
MGSADALRFAYARSASHRILVLLWLLEIQGTEARRDKGGEKTVCVPVARFVFNWPLRRGQFHLVPSHLGTFFKGESASNLVNGWCGPPDDVLAQRWASVFSLFRRGMRHHGMTNVADGRPGGERWSKCLILSI